MEQYTINFGNTWAIENINNIDKTIKLDEVNFEYPFGQCEISGGNINWILDHTTPNDEIIEKCTNIESFNKKASFKVLLLKSEWIDQNKDFEGTFIDALKFIQKEFNNEQ